MTTPRRCSTALPALSALATTLALAAGLLAGCGDDGPSEAEEAARDACRAVATADATLDGARRTLADGRPDAGTVAAYERAIRAVSEALDDDLDDALLDDARALLSAYSRSEAAAQAAVLGDGGSPSAVSQLVTAERRLLVELQERCAAERG